MTGTAEKTPTGAICVVDEEGVRVLRLSGEIDSAVVAAYEAATVLRQATVIDASRVTFLDCRALGFLVRRARAARSAGGRPVLRRPTRIVRRVIDAAEVGDLFTITA